MVHLQNHCLRYRLKVCGRLLFLQRCGGSLNLTHSRLYKREQQDNGPGQKNEDWPQNFTSALALFVPSVMRFALFPF